MGAFVSRRALSAKERGSKGGHATANSSTPEFLEKRASAAGSATRDRYGRQFYSFIRKHSTGRKSAKKIIQEVVQEIVPQAITTSTVDLMQAAAKAVVKG